MTDVEAAAPPAPVPPPPPFDAESRAALAAMPPRHDIANLTEFIDSLRDTTAFEADDDELSMGGAFALSMRHTTSYDGAQLPLMVCTPTGVVDGHAAHALPGIYFVHGGGMVSGTPRTGLIEILQMARPLGAVVVSVDYRLAPEHPDPTPLEDSYHGWVDTVTHVDDLGIDPHRLVMIGSSAGGALAAGTTLLTRDRGGAAATGVMLLNPMLDDRNDSVSALQMHGVDQWDREANDYGWTALLGDRRGTADVSAYSAPARASDLAGLPPLFLDAGSAETLRDETVRWADGIWRAGGEAELHIWPGGFHGYEFVAPHSRLAQETWQTRLRWLQRLLAE